MPDRLALTSSQRRLSMRSRRAVAWSPALAGRGWPQADIHFYERVRTKT